MSSIGKNLKEIRGAQTQDEIAKQCGVPQNQWSKWESGKSAPKLKTLLRLAAALNLPLEPFVVGVNREFDLACQKRDQESGLSTEGSQANVPAAARVELQRLRNLVAQYEAKTREVLRLSDALDDGIIALEEIGKADGRAASRGRRHRKTG